MCKVLLTYKVILCLNLFLFSILQNVPPQFTLSISNSLHWFSLPANYEHTSSEAEPWLHVSLPTMHNVIVTTHNWIQKYYKSDSNLLSLYQNCPSDSIAVVELQTTTKINDLTLCALLGDLANTIFSSKSVELNFYCYMFPLPRNISYWNKWQITL